MRKGEEISKNSCRVYMPVCHFSLKQDSVQISTFMATRLRASDSRARAKKHL